MDDVQHCRRVEKVNYETWANFGPEEDECADDGCQPTWGNFHRLGMFNLPELQMMLEKRKAGHTIDQARHREILSMLRYAAQSFELTIPEHWL